MRNSRWKVIPNFILGVVTWAAIPGICHAASDRFLPTFLVYYGDVVQGDEQRLAKYDLLDVTRRNYNQISGNGTQTWGAIKALNPDIEIYLYELAAEVANFTDDREVIDLTNLGRYDVSRGHSMGSLNGQHPELFLVDQGGNRMLTGTQGGDPNKRWHLMDFGHPDYQSYWLQSVLADIVGQPWGADGVFADNCFSVRFGVPLPAKYPTYQAWADAMNSFASAIATQLHVYNRKVWCNRGNSRWPEGAAAWIALEASTTPPDLVMEEGAFVSQTGANITQFWSEEHWKRQIDMMGAIAKSRITLLSSTHLAPDGSGVDSNQQPISFWQTLWYSMASVLIGKNDTLNNAYFMFRSGHNYDQMPWYPEYEHIDLGRAMGAYAMDTVGGVNVYRREFEYGYVYVNPIANGANNIVIAQPVKQLSHDNLLADWSTLTSVSSISLAQHHGTVLVKSAVVDGSQLRQGEARAELAGNAYEGIALTFAVPPGAETANFRMSGGTGDADLYVKHGQEPSISNPDGGYDCRPYLEGNEETCAIGSPSSGTWHILIYGYSAFSDVTIEVSYQ